jgi:hypothetical protein
MISSAVHSGYTPESRRRLRHSLNIANLERTAVEIMMRADPASREQVLATGLRYTTVKVSAGILQPESTVAAVPGRIVTTVILHPDNGRRKNKMIL